MGVANLGIGGNRVLMGGTGENALARFDRDVLDADRRSIHHRARRHQRHQRRQLRRASSRAISQLIQRAHARGMKIFRRHVHPFVNAMP